MDILTQGLLGAALAQSAARPNEARLATAVGFLSGLLADADVLIRSANDPLLTLEYHRHFTHSVFFVPIGGLVAALLLWPFLRRRLRFRRLYIFSLLGYSLSGFLDACTSYGTHLLWPLSDTRIAWSIISIVDPVFTLTLMAATIYVLVKRSPRVAWVGLGLAGVYLLAAWVQLQRAEAFARELADTRGHRIERLVVKPTLGNLVLWRSIYETADNFHVDAVRVGMATRRTYPGGVIGKFVLDAELPALSAVSRLHQDIERFSAFSDGFVARHPQRADVLGDVRYSMEPTSLVPLWGIALGLDHPERHVRWVVFRELPEAGQAEFWSMLLNRDL